MDEQGRQPQRETLVGVGVSPGRVVGPLVHMAPAVSEPPEGEPLTEDPEAATDRLRAAALAVKAGLTERAARARSESAAEVLKATALMAGDKALVKNAVKLVTAQQLSPERALWQAATAYADQMRAMGGYMAERAADIEDVRARLVAELRGEDAPGVPQRREPFVLAAEDLAPADTAVLDPDVVLALVVAGSVNIAMLLLAAAGLRGVEGTDSIEGAHAAVSSAFGPAVGLLFGIGLLASGLASSSVGCYAGETVMAGLLHRRIPTLVRRGVTLIPALVVLAVGIDPTFALVLSQVVLSFGIPFAVIPLVRLTAERGLMGPLVNRRATTAIGWAIAAVITVLNVVLVAVTITGG